MKLRAAGLSPDQEEKNSDASKVSGDEEPEHDETLEKAVEEGKQHEEPSTPAPITGTNVAMEAPPTGPAMDAGSAAASQPAVGGAV